MSSPPPSDPVNLAEVRARRLKRDPIAPEQADMMVMTHLCGCGLQLNMIAMYFTQAGMLDFAGKITELAETAKELSKQTLPTT